MKINRKLSFDETIDTSKFTDDFYSKLKFNNYEVELEKGKLKKYQFPTMFSKASVTQAMFLCSYKKALKLMPNNGIKPLRISKSKAMIIISCYSYKDISQMEAYNEIAIAVPTMNKSKINIPFLPLIAPKLFSKFGYYIANMPLNSQENLMRGPIWGFPKVLKEIQYDVKDGHSICEVFNEDGSPYLILKVPLKGKDVEMKSTSNVFTLKNERIIKSKTAFKGVFKVNKNTKQLFSKNTDNKPCLDFRNMQNDFIFKDLDINPIPFQTRYCDDLSSCIDLPEYILNKIKMNQNG